MVDIETANHSEALECWQWLDATIPQWVREKDKEHTNVLEPIKQALLNAEKEHNALEIIKNNFEIGLFETDNYKVYIYSSDDDYSVVKIISKEEFNLLKEVLE